MHGDNMSLFQEGEREREKKRERETKREREKERERDGEKERGKNDNQTFCMKLTNLLTLPII